MVVILMYGSLQASPPGDGACSQGLWFEREIISGVG